MTEVAPDPSCLLRKAKERVLESSKELTEESLKEAINYWHQKEMSQKELQLSEAMQQINRTVIKTQFVTGLILIAPHFFTEPQGLAAIRAAWDAFENGDLRQKLARYHADVDVAFRGWYDAWMDPDFAAWHVADVIDHWRIPPTGSPAPGCASGR